MSQEFKSWSKLAQPKKNLKVVTLFTSQLLIELLKPTALLNVSDKFVTEEIFQFPIGPLKLEQSLNVLYKVVLETVGASVAEQLN